MRTVRLPQPGGCACGEIRFELTALPWTSYLCHCSLCRRQSGAACGISTFVPRGSLVLSQGEPAGWPKPNSAGGLTTIRFCGRCASRLWSEREGAAHWTLRPGVLDDSAWVTPIGQMWTSAALPWALLDGVLSYGGNPDSFSDLLAAWRALDIRAAS